MLIIGLTGLIGSGKSTVAGLFAQLGVRIIDTDLIAHQLTQANGAAVAMLIAEFGSAVITPENELNRTWLREMVFMDSAMRQKLETILHPLIFAESLRQLQLASSAPYTIVVVPLLFRSPQFLGLTKRNIFVDCAFAYLVPRLKARSNLDLAQIDAILAAQVKREEQLTQADDIIENNNDLKQLSQQVLQLHKKYLGLR